MKFTESDVQYTLEAEMDHLPVRGNAMQSGDAAYDKEVEDEILDRLDHGDIWAWASVKVTASWNGIEGVDYLGGCNYKDEEDFKTPGDYYDDMKSEALADLKNKITVLQNKVCDAEVA